MNKSSRSLSYQLYILTYWMSLYLNFPKITS